MTETNAKIHVLADETLGGIKREYVEVDRKAEVGEKIVIVARNSRSESYENGEIFTVEHVWKPLEGDIESDEAKSITNGDGLIFRSEYRVLEPTDIVHIDGPDGTRRCELADRKAEVGEKVVHVDKDRDESDGIVTEVTAVGISAVDVVEYVSPIGENVVGISHGHYRVLVPVESAEADEPQPADLIDVVSNLATRVADLERENKKLHAALDEDMKIRSENTRRYLALKDEIDTLHKDNRTLGEELARLKEPTKSESIIASAPFVLVIHEGRGEFDVYQRGKKIENISRLEIEAYSRVSSSIDLEFNDVGDRP
ncbi:hypothetical protein [Bacillus sp. AF23]|uniref:hypothetical protein n=1 Tax=Bacillus sp. AF23 TaxID=2821151 RepID=UPI001E64453A|nr:hypothetical protein [Bacillus sp. AF23]MCC8352524.1 hypothetical protein [Bacillus sp. AF23]